jgi:hypothetical protein
VSRGALRFLDAATLSAFLSGAGLRIEAQFGDWTRQPLTDTSPEIITVARKGAEGLSRSACRSALAVVCLGLVGEHNIAFQRKRDGLPGGPG